LIFAAAIHPSWRGHRRSDGRPFAAVVGALDRQPNLAARSLSDIVIVPFDSPFRNRGQHDWRVRAEPIEVPISKS
jgi:hypothetical protein